MFHIVLSSVTVIVEVLKVTKSHRGTISVATVTGSWEKNTDFVDWDCSKITDCLMQIEL